MRRFLRWLLVGGALVVAFLVVEPAIRWALKPSPPPPSEAQKARAAGVTILRDRFGMAHIFGPTDADTAFGLAYAHAEDDFPMIQNILAASRGRLGLVKPGWGALLNDGFASLIGVEEELARTWPSLDPHVRDVFDGYADGINLYASTHPDEVDARLLPFEGRDIGRGFIHKLPLMIGLNDTLKALSEGAPAPPSKTESMPGSNAHAVGPWRSTDGVTRLNINSHQPWQGPVTWYEVAVHSDEGWDMVGGTFPGGPMLLHGTTDKLGWALTVNTPDRVDVYEVFTDEAHPGTYRYGGEWKPFESKRAWLPLDTPWLTLWIPRTFLRSVHGPVLQTDHGTFAVRYVSMEQGVRAAEQWFKMNKAQDLAEWYSAMEMQAIPMFNTVYADAGHILYLYNARIPKRAPGHDYTSVLPGDDPSLVWTDVLPLQALPQVLDPVSGFVQGCNSTPYSATIGAENPIPDMFPETAGIETRVTNRSRRTLELLADGAPLDRAAFLALKWDRSLALDAPMRELLLDPIRAWPEAELAKETADVKRARELLLAWDGSFDEDDIGATIAVLSWRPLEPMGNMPKPGYDPKEGLRFAARFLRGNRDRIDVPLGEVQRLVHGETDLPLGGGPDILNCTYHEIEGDKLVGDQGDSLVMLAEYSADGARAWSINPYGISNRPASPHYSDQAPLFVDRQLRPVLRKPEEIRKFLEAEYHPGEVWVQGATAAPEERLKEMRAVWGE